MPTIGIPRSLLYYYYHPAWQGFFESLGGQIRVSPPSDDSLLEIGIENSVADLCLPFKMLYGHVLSLAEEVDYIFLPRVMSVTKKEYLCPKFLGLPDLFRNSELKLPPLITPIINLYRGRAAIYKSIWSVGRLLTRNPQAIKRACLVSKQRMSQQAEDLLQGNIWLDGERKIENRENYTFKVGVIGHSYVILDSHISKNIIDYLDKRNIKVITAENIAPQNISKGLTNCPKDIFWTYNKKMWGAGSYLGMAQKIDGLIQISSFGCGPDSILKDLLQRRLRVPFLPLNVDEHTGQAGLETRLEAFLDLLGRWHKANEKSNLPPSRESLHSFRGSSSIHGAGTYNAATNK